MPRQDPRAMSRDIEELKLRFEQIVGRDSYEGDAPDIDEINAKIASLQLEIDNLKNHTIHKDSYKSDYRALEGRVISLEEAEKAAE